MFITLTKDGLLKLLAAQLVRATEDDKNTAKAHKQDEKNALAKFKVKLREALKWNYKTAKEKRWNDMPSISTPSCPILQANVFSTMIENVTRDMRKSPYRIHDGSDIDKALKWVPKSERVSATVCDSD